jgi:cell division septation protein DedD
MLARVNIESMRSSQGALAWPYKVAVVGVMSLVACGTLVTFGTAGAEPSDSSVDAAALPGTNEASPQVQGQVLPPAQSLLTSQDLLSTLNLTDYSPVNADALEDEDEKDDEKKAEEKKKKKAAAAATAAAGQPATAATTSTTPTTSSPSPAPTTNSPSPSPSPKPSPTPTPTPTQTTPPPTPTGNPNCQYATWRALNPGQC